MLASRTTSQGSVVEVVLPSQAALLRDVEVFRSSKSSPYELDRVLIYVQAYGARDVKMSAKYCALTLQVMTVNTDYSCTI